MTMQSLCPAQTATDAMLKLALKAGDIVVVYGGTGHGKTTVLQHANRELGGVFLTMADYVAALRGQHPLAMEETFEALVRESLDAAEAFVFLDDLHLITNVLCGCGGFSTYPRPKFLEAPLTALCAYAAAVGKKLIFGCEGATPSPVSDRCYYAGIDKFGVEDYRFLCQAYLGAEVAANLDYAKIHRFAPKLNAHQLRGACLWLRESPHLDTDQFIDYLRARKMASNVDLGEVQAVDLHELKGLDDLLQSLEANIILPLENDTLASELDIRPKRGVLLAGPPGTGKTTVGRALAHRLKSKFFLVDGTFISGTRNFYERIHQVFEAAKDNAPSIIFIDDSDVIFQNNEEMGLYRYLLTMLDGLESESVGRVCVMMTAMDVGNLPPALIRSGRVELWLETRLPDQTARAAILAERAARLPAVLQDIDLAMLAGATEDLTGADIKRVMEDGKILYAYDRAQNAPIKPLTEYFLAAIETVRINKEHYAQAEERATRQQGARPAWFDVMSNMAAAAQYHSEDGDF